MFQTHGYPAHPTHFDSRSPYTPLHPVFANIPYREKFYYETTSPQPKTHARRATGDGTTAYANTTPRKTTYNTQHYPSPPAATQYASARSTPQRKHDYVSGSHNKQRDNRTRCTSRTYETAQHHRPPCTRNVWEESGDSSYESLPQYESFEQRPPPYASSRSYNHHHYRHESRADQHYYDQVPIYTSAEPAQRPRRSSHSTRQPQPPPRAARPARPSPPKATAEDARRAEIPAGYCYKSWDPTEEPILLLGSVFDANSLGKWIYDWTVFSYGPATPMTEIAGDLWLLLIHLAGKIKRAEACLDRIRRTSSRDTVGDFLESGERLWTRFSKILKVCETAMWRAAKRDKGNLKNVTMGQNTGCEFVDAIFGRDRELENTEQLMTGMRLWSMRFDANCEEILRYPGA